MKNLFDWLFRNKEPKEKKCLYELSVFLFGGKVYYYTQLRKPSKEIWVGEHLRFYNWYYNLTTKAYTFKHTQGDDIIIRKNILSISMWYTKEV